MKRIWTLSLLALMLLSLAACGSADTTQQSETTAWDNTPLASLQTTAGIEEVVLVDEQGVRITATGLSYTSYSAELALTIENNSSADLTFASGTMGYNCNAINSYMMSGGYLYCDVPSGKKANETVRFSSDDLQLCGISEIAEIEIGFDISDDDYNHFYTGPRQIQTSAFESFDPQQNTYQQTIAGKAAQIAYGYELLHFSDDVLYEQNGISVISTALIRNQDGDDILILEAQNQSSQTACLSVEQIAVNGLTVYNSIWTAETINPGKHALLNIALASLLGDTQRTAFGIDEIGVVSFTLEQIDGMGTALTEPVDVTVPFQSDTSTYDSTGSEVYSDFGIRLVAKDVVADDSDYSDNLHLLLLAENNSGTDIRISNVYDSLSINGYMVDYTFLSADVKNGSAAMLDVELWEDDLETCGITSPEDIQELEISFEIRAGRTTVGTPVARLTKNAG